MKTRRKVRLLFGKVKAPPQKRRAVARAESVETQDYVAAPPLTSCLEQKIEAEDQKTMEEVSFVPSAVREPRWVLDMFDDKCTTKGFKFFEIAAVVSEKREACRTRSAVAEIAE